MVKNEGAGSPFPPSTLVACLCRCPYALLVSMRILSLFSARFFFFINAYA